MQSRASVEKRCENPVSCDTEYLTVESAFRFRSCEIRSVERGQNWPIMGNSKIFFQCIKLRRVAYRNGARRCSTDLMTPDFLYRLATTFVGERLPLASG